MRRGNPCQQSHRARPPCCMPCLSRWLVHQQRLPAGLGRRRGRLLLLLFNTTRMVFLPRLRVMFCLKFGALTLLSRTVPFDTPSKAMLSLLFHSLPVARAVCTHCKDTISPTHADAANLQCPLVQWSALLPMRSCSPPSRSVDRQRDVPPRPTARPLRPDDLTLRPCICSRRLTPNLGPQTRHQGSAPVNMDADQVFMSHLTNELRRCVREDGDKSDAS